jgi:hypothetical protein
MRGKPEQGLNSGLVSWLGHPAIQRGTTSRKREKWLNPPVCFLPRFHNKLILCLGQMWPTRPQIPACHRYE